MSKTQEQLVSEGSAVLGHFYVPPTASEAVDMIADDNGVTPVDVLTSIARTLESARQSGTPAENLRVRMKKPKGKKLKAVVEKLRVEEEHEVELAASSTAE